MKIPYEQLKPDTLRAVIEEFVTREGTDYGHDDVPLDTKVQQVIQQLKSGKASITYNQQMQTCSIVSEE